MAKPPKSSKDERRPPPGDVPGDGRRPVDDRRSRLDPYFQLVLELIDAKDWPELEFRTGIRVLRDRTIEDPGKDPDPVHLSMLVGLGPGRPKDVRLLKAEIKKRGLEVPPVYYELELTSESEVEYVPARIALDPDNPALLYTRKGKAEDEDEDEYESEGEDEGQEEDGNEDQEEEPNEGEDKPITLRDQLEKEIFARNSSIDHLELAVSHQPCLEESLRHIGLPIDRTFRGEVLKGKGVIVGIIDDGCAFAHRHFLSYGADARWGTRILSLWDQSQKPTRSDRLKGWRIPPKLRYGRELRKAKIDPVINANVSASGAIAEDAVYDHFRYTPGAPDELSTHGTHVMDIAAGNGASLMGWEGVAPEADIVFVQLSPVDILNPGETLSKGIADGMAYIFKEAKILNRPVVVNLSLGGNHGPHDETWHWVKHIDRLLAHPNRVVVVSAGNGFEQDTHAGAILFPGQEATLPWIVKPEDPTSNDVEIWYNGDAALEVVLTTPDALVNYGPYVSGTSITPINYHGKDIGHVAHEKLSSDKCVFITLRATQDPLPGAVSVPPPVVAWGPAPAGTWTITLRNTGTKNAQFDAWIQRDDVGKLGGRRQQSRFAPGVAYPGSTICDYASGKRTISVGAFNVGTQEVSRYSACGPTRVRPAKPGRQKPDICAPAEEDVAGRGILSASSRRAQPTRMNGTSAAAPHVAGLVALILEYARSYAGTNLTADEIRAGIVAAGQKAGLLCNRHQIADVRVPIKQEAVFADLVGGGKIDFLATMDLLF